MPFTAPKGSNRYRYIQTCPFHLGMLHRNTSHRLTLLYSSESYFREPACNASCFSTFEAIGEDYKAGVGKLASLLTAANCSDKKHAVMLPQRKLRREANPCYILLHFSKMINLCPPFAERFARAFENGSIVFKHCFYAPLKAAWRAWICSCVSFAVD